MSEAIRMMPMAEVLKDRRLQIEIVDWYIAVFNDTGKGEWSERWTADTAFNKLFHGESLRPEMTYVTMFRSDDGVLAGVSIATVGSIDEVMHLSDLPPQCQTEEALKNARRSIRWVAGDATIVFFREMGIRRDFRGGLRKPLDLLISPIVHMKDAHGATFGYFWTSRPTRLFPLMAGLDVRLIHEFKDDADNVIMGEDLVHAARRFSTEERKLNAIIPARLAMRLAPPVAPAPTPVQEQPASQTHPADLLPESDKPYVAERSERCEGAHHADKYVLTVKVATSVVPKEFVHAHAPGLDEINAFDRAEIDGAYMGQLNVIPVSSFVGPQGELWGHTVARQDDVAEEMFGIDDGSGKLVPVFDGSLLVEATERLFGNVETKRFPLAPGTLCPAATKKAFGFGPCVVYATLAIGIPEEGSDAAIILMEDAGSYAQRDGAAMWRMRHDLTQACAKSVAAVARNQGTRLQKVYVVNATEVVDEDSVGCGLVIAPYIRLARNAIPEGGMAALRKMSLQDWLKGR